MDHGSNSMTIHFNFHRILTLFNNNSFHSARSMYATNLLKPPTDVKNERNELRNPEKRIILDYFLYPNEGYDKIGENSLAFQVS